MERRIDQRISHVQTIHVIRCGRLEPVEMREVSQRGLFLRMASPPGQRELVKLRIDLPTGCVVAHAVAVRVVAEDAAGLFGVGLRLFALTSQEKTDWEAFVRRLASELRRAA